MNLRWTVIVWTAGVGTLIGALLGVVQGIGSGFIIWGVLLLAGIGLISSVIGATAALIAWKSLKLSKRWMKIAVTALVAALSSCLVSGWMLSAVMAVDAMALSLVFAVTAGAVPIVLSTMRTPRVSSVVFIEDELSR